MKWVQVRFTVRRMMIAVALVAVMIVLVREGDRMRRRMRLHSRIYMATSSEHSSNEFYYLHLSKDLMGQAEGFAARVDRTSLEVADEKRIRATEVRDWAQYEAGLASKYKAASLSPWWRLPPDPPTPPSRRPEVSERADVKSWIQRLTKKLNEL